MCDWVHVWKRAMMTTIVKCYSRCTATRRSSACPVRTCLRAACSQYFTVSSPKVASSFLPRYRWHLVSVSLSFVFLFVQLPSVCKSYEVFKMGVLDANSAWNSIVFCGDQIFQPKCRSFRYRFFAFICSPPSQIFITALGNWNFLQ